MAPVTARKIIVAIIHRCALVRSQDRTNNTHEKSTTTLRWGDSSRPSQLLQSLGSLKLRGDSHDRTKNQKVFSCGASFFVRTPLEQPARIIPPSRRGGIIRAAFGVCVWVGGTA